MLENLVRLQVSPGSSRLCRNYLILIHSLALLAAANNDLPVAYRVLLAATVSLNFGFSFKRYIVAPPGFTLRHSEAYGWQLAEGDGVFFPVTLRRSTVSSALLSIVHVERPDGKKQSLLIFSDSLPADQYRQLRVALKISTLD